MEQRIIFKINLICFKILNNLAPGYLVDLIHVYEPARYLRSSSDKGRLVIKPYNLKTYGLRAFSVIAPILWNDMPIDIRSIDDVNKFKSKLILIFWEWTQKKFTSTRTAYRAGLFKKVRYRRQRDWKFWTTDRKIFVKPDPFNDVIVKIQSEEDLNKLYLKLCRTIVKKSKSCIEVFIYLMIILNFAFTSRCFFLDCFENLFCG